MKIQLSNRKIHFENGFWWFHEPGGRGTFNIGGIIHQSGWSVSVLCGILRIPLRTFERVTTTSLGITAKQWLRQLRMVRAMHLLREGRQVKSVAVTLGFRHPGDFSKEFVLVVGVTPKVYQASERARSSE